MTSAMPERRFLPPWTVELDACFVVRDHNGQQLFQVVIETQKVAGPISDAGADVEVPCSGLNRAIARHVAASTWRTYLLLARR
jgi:hypothetical protein